MAVCSFASMILGCFLLYLPCCFSEIMRTVVPPLTQLYRFGNMEGFEGDQAPDNAMATAIIGNLNHTKNSGAQKDCCICLEAFKDDDEVTPLPCDPRHYFHEECIAGYMKTNNICPLCRKEITPEALE